MLISMTIMGLVLALAVVEFAMVFNHNNLATANLTADQNARISMAKVANEMRQAMPDITDFTTPPYPVVVSPTMPPPSTAPAPAQSIEYYRADNGAVGLNGTMPVDTAGDPLPCYDEVQLTYDPIGKTITRTITPLNTNGNCTATVASSNVLAHNILGFSVEPIQASGTTPILFDVDLQTQATTGDYGIYDLNTQVTLGYNGQ
jgi:hypothetical protein